jgi:hypothetical protein
MEAIRKQALKDFHEKGKTALENELPIPPEVVEFGINALIKLFSDWLTTRKALRQRVTALESLSTAQNEIIAKMADEIYLIKLAIAED